MACSLAGQPATPAPGTPASTLTSTSAVDTPTPQQTSSLPLPHKAVERDITYCAADGVSLKADIYFAQNTSRPVPLLIFIHGGTWSSGSKDGGMGFDGMTVLTNWGYTLASIDYRLAPQYKMPAMIEDAKCAVRSFRAHAAEYGIDPDKIAVIGASAGGHLAAMLGTTDQSAGFDVGEYQGYSSQVQAVVDMAGPSDLRKPFTSDSGQVADQVFGTRNPADPRFAAASPVTWVSPGDAPFLIIHGDEDQRVPLAQSQELYRALVAAGLDARLIVVKNAGHGIDYPDQSPTKEELIRAIVQFLQAKLKYR
jgi:acetyl esterase/lipase